MAGSYPGRNLSSAREMSQEVSTGNRTGDVANMHPGITISSRDSSGRIVPTGNEWPSAIDLIRRRAPRIYYVRGRKRIAARAKPQRGEISHPVEGSRYLCGIESQRGQTARVELRGRQPRSKRWGCGSRPRPLVNTKSVRDRIFLCYAAGRVWHSVQGSGGPRRDSSSVKLFRRIGNFIRS